MAAVLLAEINLVVQVAAFVILITAVMHAKKKDFPVHFKYAGVAASLLSISFLWMGYSFLNNIPLFILSPAAPSSLLVFAHVASGTPALLGGISFALGRFIKKTLIPMRITFFLWALAFFIGMAIYIVYYLL